MDSQTEPTEIVAGNNFGFDKGLTVEHVMLSITVVSTKESAGQFDDSIAGVVRRELVKHHGVVDVLPEVLYKHTKIEQHSNGCECGYCKPRGQLSQ